MNETPQKYSVFVVEDHGLVRDALTAMVKRTSILKLAGQASDGATAISLIEQAKPDVAVVDFALPDMTGLEVITKVRMLLPETRYLILTGSPMDEMERVRLSEFAEGFMHKETGREALISAIIETAKSPPLTAKEVTDISENKGIVNAGALTKRERMVLREIARGHSVDQIATGLGVSPSTIRKHRENIMTKLKLNSTAQLVRAAMQIGPY